MNSNDDYLSSLESNKRDKKVAINDIAISKVPFIEYKSISADHYETLHYLAKAVLQISKDENDSNEIAIVYDLDSPFIVGNSDDYIAWARGDEDSVDPASDTETNHILVSAKGCVIVVLHNHPNLSKVSLEDVAFLLKYAAVKMIVAVTNRGSIGYVVKSEKYDRLKALEILRTAIDMNNSAKTLQEKQDASDYFIKNCYQAGLLYDDK